MAEPVFWYAAVGMLAGLLAGLLGVGGGLVIVPALAWLFLMQGFPEALYMQLAVGSSLAVIVPTSLASIRAHHRRGSVRGDLLVHLTPGILIGTAAGVVLAKNLDGTWLRLLFGMFECLVGLQLLSGVNAAEHHSVPARPGLWMAGGLIGAVSALLGIGGGTLTVPFLRWHGVEIRSAVGTAAAAGFPIALAGATGFWLAGRALPALPDFTSGFLYWPAILIIALVSVPCAPLGAALAHRLPRAWLQRLFGALLLVVGLRMAWTG